jgi:hypothetical protein
MGCACSVHMGTKNQMQKRETKCDKQRKLQRRRELSNNVGIFCEISCCDVGFIEMVLDRLQCRAFDVAALNFRLLLRVLVL